MTGIINPVWINDPSLWATITHSLAAPVIEPGVPQQWTASYVAPDKAAYGPGTTQNNCFYLVGTPSVDTGPQKFSGLKYIGPPIAPGYFSVFWADRQIVPDPPPADQSTGTGLLTISNQSGVTLASENIQIYGLNGTLATSPLGTTESLFITFISNSGPELPIPITINLFYFYLSTPPPATGFGRRIWRPRDNAVC